MVNAGSLIVAVDDVAPGYEIVPAVPVFGGEEVAFLHLLLGATAGPGVEEVAVPARRSYQQVLRALAVRVAVEIA